MKLQNWPDWDNAFNAQLDAYLKAGCIGTPALPFTNQPSSFECTSNSLDKFCED